MTILERDPPIEVLRPGMAWVNSSLHEWRVCTEINDGGVSVLSQPLRKDTVIFQQFSIEKYVSLLFTLTLAFAAIFQAPVVVLLLGWVGLIDNAFLNKYRRHALLGCLVIAAFISPGDPTSLVLMWFPLMALYELGGLLLRLFPASPRPRRHRPRRHRGRGMSRRLLWLAISRQRPAPPPKVQSFHARPLRPDHDGPRPLLAHEAAAIGEVPVGAVVFHSTTGKVLGEGFNHRETDHDPAAHAELLAIRQASTRLGDWAHLNDYSLAVTLEPCVMCAGLIVNARVGRLIFGAMDPKAGAVGSLYHITQDPRLNHRVVPISGVLATRSAAILRTFFAAVRTRTPQKG